MRNNLFRGGWMLLYCLLDAQMAHAQWQLQKITTQASLRGLSVVNDKIIWASGIGGTFVKTTDGGQTWRIGQVAGAKKRIINL